MTGAQREIERKAAKIQDRLEQFSRSRQRQFATSSFQTHSIPLLHIISSSSVDIPIVFINTGYLFPETLEFRDEIGDLLELNIIDSRPIVPKSEQRTNDGRLLFAANPDKCCYLNKIAPVESYLREYDVWINGVRSEQNLNRGGMRIEQHAPYNTLRYHPMLDWTDKDVSEYRRIYKLPAHPLEEFGYLSIGCMPCTVRMAGRAGSRDGRWPGQAKTECGLHTELALTTQKSR